MSKMNWKKVIGWGVAALVIGFIIYFNSQAYRSKDNDKVLISANFPLTGAVAVYGNSFKNGLLLSYNDNKEKIKYPVEFDWGDNQFSAMDTVSVMQRQLFKNPTIYTSALKPQTNAVDKKIAEAGIPHFVWIPDRKINLDGMTNEFRTWVNLQNEADMFVDYISKLKANRVVIFHTETPTSHEIYKHYIPQQLKKYNKDVEILLLEFPVSDVADLRTLVQKASQFNPEAIIINGFIQQMTSVVQLLKSYQVLDNNRILASFDILDALDMIDNKVSDGLVVVAPQYMVKPTEQELQWAKKYRSVYNIEPNYHAAFAYDMGLVIWDAINKLGTKATNKEWIDTLKKTDIQGITGHITFDDMGDIQTKMYLSTIKNGKIVPVTE